MRIVAGEYGGRKLKALAGDNTRPTSDKIKGAIFNMIGPYFDGGAVLDLFAGSGGLGIEAVSRGCAHGVLVDKNFQAIKVIQENVGITKEPEKFTVLKSEANQALMTFSQSGQHFDYIFLDPPYAQQEIVNQIEKVLASELLTANGIIICEVGRGVDLPAEIQDLKVFKRKNYGTTEIVIYRK